MPSISKFCVATSLHTSSLSRDCEKILIAYFKVTQIGRIALVGFYARLVFNKGKSLHSTLQKNAKLMATKKISTA